LLDFRGLVLRETEGEYIKKERRKGGDPEAFG